MEYEAQEAREVGSYCSFEYAECFVTYTEHAHLFFNPCGVPNTKCEREAYGLEDIGEKLISPDFKIFCTTTVGKKLCRITVMAPSLEKVEQAEQVLKDKFNEKYGGPNAYWMKTMHPHHCLYCLRRDHRADDCRHCYFCSQSGHKILDCDE